MEISSRQANPNAKLYSTYCEEWLDKYIGNHHSVIDLKEQVRKLSIEQDSVLIVGPSGTGKELLARALHGARTGKFVGINCTALPSELIESELFGHKKGAFTGASDDRIGAFQEAWDGTIFLDEIGDMPALMQAKLLRVLQEQEFKPLGGRETVKCKCRVVAATNKDLPTLFGTKHFRDDLYYRLAMFELRTIALLERYEDIEEIVDSLGGEQLVNEFVKYCAGVPQVEDKIRYATFFNLAGNVRTLQAQVRRYLVLGSIS